MKKRGSVLLIWMGLLMLVAAVFTGCVSIRSAAQGLPHRDRDYKIEEVKKPLSLTGSFWTNISYESRNFLIEKEKKTAEAELRSPDYSDIPETGIITIQLNAVAFRLTKPEHCVYILRTEDGEELLRQAGNPELPVLADPSESNRWFSYDSIVLDRPIRFPVQIRIVNSEIPAEYWEYKIVKKEEKDQEKS